MVIERGGLPALRSLGFAEDSEDVFMAFRDEALLSAGNDILRKLILLMRDGTFVNTQLGI